MTFACCHLSLIVLSACGRGFKYGGVKKLDSFDSGDVKKIDDFPGFSAGSVLKHAVLKELNWNGLIFASKILLIFLN